MVWFPSLLIPIPSLPNTWHGRISFLTYFLLYLIPSLPRMVWFDFLPYISRCSITFLRHAWGGLISSLPVFFHGPNFQETSRIFLFSFWIPSLTGMPILISFLHICARIWNFIYPCPNDVSTEKFRFFALNTFFFNLDWNLTPKDHLVAGPSTRPKSASQTQCYFM